MKVGAAGGAAAAVLGAGGCAESRPVPDAAGDQNGPPPFELDELSIDALNEGIAAGRWTSVGLTQLYLERIDQVDGRVHSVIETNSDAMGIAEGLDAERAAGNVRGPLHGIPILVKDNIDTADTMTTSAGSLALEGWHPPQDSWVAERLRASGAILIGKANMSEWANFRSTHSSSGWSARGGQCRNPYALDRNPCGSSSGSGAAVSASFAAAAIGTETDGSIACPSSANGLVGLKPTVGLVGRSGIIPISHTQDTAGPMCRSVRDAAIVLGALTGVDPRDATTDASVGNTQPDYTTFLDPAGLRGARIGVARGFFGFHPAVDEMMEEALAAMREAGAEVVDPADITTNGDIAEPEYQVLLYEFKAGVDAYLAGVAPTLPVHSLEELIAFNEANRERELAYFGQEILEESVAKGPLTERAYLDALALSRRLSREQGIDATMDEHRLDAVVGPTGGPAWTIDLVNSDHYSGGSSTPAAVAGYPSITVPAGLVRGLPVGISFFGRAWSEPVLLRIAFAFEQATNHRRRPGFLPTLGIA
jgi:amidase